MFNKQLTDVLGQLCPITNSIILKYPETVAISDSGDMLVYVNVAALDPTEFPNIGFNKSLKTFLDLMKMFPQDRSVELVENTIVIKSGQMESVYITDNIALMDAYDKSTDQFNKVESAPSVASFDLTVEDMKSIKSGAGVFKDLSEIIFTSQDGDMIISLGATNKFNARSNKLSIRKNGNTKKEFEVKIPIENFSILPLSEYVFEVKYNSERDAYRLYLKNKSFDGFKIIMSVKA